MLQFCPWMLAPDYYRDLFHCLPEYSEADIWLLCLIWRINLFLYVLDSIVRTLGMLFQHATKVKFTQQTIAALWAEFCVLYVFLLFSALSLVARHQLSLFSCDQFFLLLSLLCHILTSFLLSLLGFLIQGPYEDHKSFLNVLT